MVESGFALHPAARVDRPRGSAALYRNLLLAALTALYVVLICFQIGRHLWFDELLTLHIAQEHSLGRLLGLVEAWDLNPPVLHVLASLCLRVAHGNALAIRIPSVVEFYAASILLLVYAARKVGWAFAALPVLLLWYGPIFRFATEARPYAALCCWFCALLVVWDAAVNGRLARRGWLLAGVATASLGLLATHVFAPLSLLPFCVAEAVRWRRRRVPDWPLWAALFLPLAVIFIYVPFYFSYRTITEYPAAFQAGWEKLASYFWHTSTAVWICLAAAMLAGWLVSRKGAGARSEVRWSRPDIALWVTLAGGVPLLLVLAMMSEHAPFWGRYCITSALALYFIFAYLAARALGGRAVAGYAASAAATLALLVHCVVLPAYTAAVQPEPKDFAALERIHPDLPVVAASGLTFVEMGYYEPPATRARLFYLLDRQAAIQFANATLFEDMRRFQSAFQLPGTVEPFARFTHAHRTFLVIGTFNYPEDWLLRKLASDGAQITKVGDYVTPYKDKSLFEVHLQR